MYTYIDIHMFSFYYLMHDTNMYLSLSISFSLSIYLSIFLSLSLPIYIYTFTQLFFFLLLLSLLGRAAWPAAHRRRQDSGDRGDCLCT